MQLKTWQGDTKNTLIEHDMIVSVQFYHKLIYHLANMTSITILHAFRRFNFLMGRCINGLSRISTVRARLRKLFGACFIKFRMY